MSSTANAPDEHALYALALIHPLDPPTHHIGWNAKPERSSTVVTHPLESRHDASADEQTEPPIRVVDVVRVINDVDPDEPALLVVILDAPNEPNHMIEAFEYTFAAEQERARSAEDDDLDPLTP